MQVFHEKEAARQWVTARTAKGQSVGLVPTMGALHAGHLSLVDRSRHACETTVTSIFVNPTQFGPHEDLDRYPRTLEADLEQLAQAGVDAVFTPEAGTIYPEGFSTFVAPPALACRWEGEQRPAHFRGVATIVAKLFHLLPATHAFFGQKDYQQARVLQRMVTDLDFAIEVVVCPIVREADGLAMSSRNRYLDAAARQRALALPAALTRAEEAFSQGERHVAALEQLMRLELESRVDALDYAVVVDAETLEPVAQVERTAVALIAADVAGTRLIDNRLFPV